MASLAGPFQGNRDFLKFWAAEGVSQVGSQVSLIALPIIAAVTLDASPVWLGILAACGQAPALFFGLFVGAWLDHRRRRPVLVAADLVRAALILTIPAAAWFDQLSIVLLCAIAFAMGTFTIVFDIGYLSYLPTLVDRGHLVEANSRLEATASGAQVAGPAMGGALVGLLSGPVALAIDSMSFLGSAMFLKSIRKPESEPKAPAQGESVWKRVKDGLGYVGRHPVLRALAGCSAVTNLFGNAFLAVYVAFMIRELDLTEAQIGIVFAVGGLGALAGSILAHPIVQRLGVARTLIGAQFGFGVTGLLVPLAVFVPAVALPLVIAAEFLQWMTLLIYAVNAISLRQRLTSDEMQARLHATFMFVARGAQPIGSLLGGIVASVIGLSMTLVVSELGMFVAVAWLLVSPLWARSRGFDEEGERVSTAIPA